MGPGRFALDFPGRRNQTPAEWQHAHSTGPANNSAAASTREGTFDEDQLPGGGSLCSSVLAARRAVVRLFVQQAMDGAGEHDGSTGTKHERGSALHHYFHPEPADLLCPRAVVLVAQRQHRRARRRDRRVALGGYRRPYYLHDAHVRDAAEGTLRD